MAKTDKIDSKTKILNAATRLFARKGYDGTTVDEIMAEAAVNKSLIYYYFKSKEQMLEEVIKGFIKEIEELRVSYFKRAGKEIEESLIDEFMMTIIAFCKERRDVLNIIMMQLMITPTNSYILKFFDESLDLSFSGHSDLGNILADNVRVRLRFFYRGIIPIIFYVLLNDKWCDYYKINEADIDKSLMKEFRESYLVLYSTAQIETGNDI